MAGGEWKERREEDRLPWLETVDEDYGRGSGVWRVLLLVLLGVALIAAAVFGIFRLQRHHHADGNGDLINAQEGDYKVRPENPGGSKVTGEGEAAIATAQGKDTGSGGIDNSQMAEAPITAAKPQHAAAPKPAASKVVATVPTGPAKAEGGGSVVQLGSFPSQAAADAAWTAAAKRHAFVAGLGHNVQQAEVGGRTVYRLRVNSGSTAQAGEICDKLKAAGQACFVAHD